MAAIPRRVDLVLLGAFEALPPPVRRLIARPVAPLLERLVRRLGTSPRTAARARRQVARLALRYGLLDAARDVLATIPEARQADFELVRARQAMD